MRAFATLIVAALAAVPAAGAKDFHPGDLRVCNARTCVPLTARRALDAFDSFYYSGPRPVAVPTPPLRSPCYELKFTNGYVTGIVATARLDRFLSYGVNIGQFPRGKWYRVPPRAAQALRSLTSRLRPLRLTRAAIAKNR